MKYSAKKVWKYLTHNFYKAMAIASVLAFSSEALAVTDNEMDQAEAIAAKFYIRYVNNASGYLDNFTPTSMADLESRLANDKDKESFREFKKSSRPSDYASWDKDKLVEYWSITFFQNNSSHLDSKGANNGEARVRIKKGISAIQITPPPAPAPEPSTVQEEPDVEPEMPEPVADNNQYDPLAGHYMNENQTELLDEMEALKDSIAAEDTAVAEGSKSSGTWIYIVILAILVVVVVILVVYASRTMKSPKKRRDDDEDLLDDRTGGFRPVQASDDRPVYKGESGGYARVVADEARLREKYSQSLAEKSEEIMQLSRQLTDMEMKAAQLKEENRLLKLELEGYRNAEAERTAARQSAVAASSQTASNNHGVLHEVYLGRVNSKGIFVRADRQPVEGQSIYRLSTANGVSGTFTVINNSYLDRQLLSDPEKWLAGGCTAVDLYTTRGYYSVQTETPGQAEFRDGAWRVVSKAVIRYV